MITTSGSQPLPIAFFLYDHLLEGTEGLSLQTTQADEGCGHCDVWASETPLGIGPRGHCTG